jgi:hypothetical protein
MVSTSDFGPPCHLPGFFGCSDRQIDQNFSFHEDFNRFEKITPSTVIKQAYDNQRTCLYCFAYRCCLFCACISHSDRMCFFPHSLIVSRNSIMVRPIGVSVYSTLGRGSGYDFLSMIPSRSSSRSCSVNIFFEMAGKCCSISLYRTGIEL